MEDKKIDNDFINTKNKINQLDNMIDNEKSRIKKLDDVQDSMNALNRNLNTCIDLLSKSIKGNKVDNMFDDMRDSNKTLYQNISSFIDEEMDSSRKIVNNLFKEKDDIIKENKDQK